MENQIPDSNSSESKGYVKPYEYVIVIIASLIPGLGIFAFLFFLSDSYTYRRQGSTVLLWISFSCMATVTFLLVLFSSSGSLIGKSKESEVRGNLLQIKIGLERYTIDHEGRYPSDITDLINGHYLGDHVNENDFSLNFPINPYTGEQMKNIPFGSSPCEGEFTYLPYGFGDEFDGYYLITYGSSKYEHEDVNGDGVDDHVILTLTSYAPRNPEFESPSLSELLNAQQSIAETQFTVEPENVR